MQVVQTVQLQLLLAIRAFFVEFADACDLGAVSDSALRLGLDFKNVAEGQVRNSDIGPGSFKCMIIIFCQNKYGRRLRDNVFLACRVFC